MSGQPRWWRADIHADRRPFLAARGRIIVALRGFFAAEDFTEVEAAALQVSPGNETHLHAFATELVETSGARRRLYLHTSPEFACKKLLAAGETRIFDFARVFRNRERSALHHPEFTLLEWYRAHDTYETLMEDCERVLAAAAEAAGATEFRYRGKTADPLAEPERLSVAGAFRRYAGIDLMGTMSESIAEDAALSSPPCGEAESARSAEPGEGAEVDTETQTPHPLGLRRVGLSPRGRGDGASPGKLAAEAERIGVRVAADDSWSDVFSRIMSERIEPELGIGRATVLYDYPVSEAALARRKAEDPRLAERFELYVCGVELANGFGELTDPAEQRRRFEADMEEKLRIYGEAYPIDEEFLAALAVMPPAAGIALGLDRLVMLATGASRIEQVIWTPLPPEVSA